MYAIRKPANGELANKVDGTIEVFKELYDIVYHWDTQHNYEVRTDITETQPATKKAMQSMTARKALGEVRNYVDLVKETREKLLSAVL